MMIDINRNSKSPIYIQIKNAIKKKIIDGEILKNFQLPPERVLAAKIGVHRNTVIKAYQELINEDLVKVSYSPRGYFVNYTVCGELQNQDFCSNIYSPFDYMLKDEFYHADNLFNRLFYNSIDSKVISFAGQIASPKTYPKNQIKSILYDLINSDKDELYGYCPSQGLISLRENISILLAERQIVAYPSEIQILTESMQALDYIIKLYMYPKDVIIVEEPILTDTFNYFKLAGIKPITVQMDENGMMTKCLEQMIVKYKPKFIYTVPDFHNPTTSVMSLERRYELLNIAYKYNIPIIEEDCDYEFRYESPNIPPLKAIDKRNIVIYIDSFIFTLFPGARIAYMVAPKQVISKISFMVDIEQIFINSISQYLTNEFIKRGYYKEHVKKIRDYYKTKRDVLCEELGNIKDIEFRIPQGGTCLWCNLPQNINQEKLLRNANNLGVLFIPGFLFFPYGDQGENYIRLSYSDISVDKIKEGIKLLNKALKMSLE